MATAITTIDIMNITQTKPSLLAFWWKTWLAILLLAFGLPSLVARLILLPGDQTRIDLLAGGKVELQDLQRFYASRRAAGAWFPENALYNDLAMASLNLSQRTEGETSKAFLQEAAVWESKALNVSPADAYGWYRMAYLYFMVEGASSPRAAKAWGLSMASAPYEPRLVSSRLQMAIGLGPSFLDETVARLYVPNLIRSAWEDDPDRLAKLAYDGSFISLVEEALRNDPDDLASFREKTGVKTHE